MPIVADAAAAVRADMSGFNRDLQQGGEKATRTLGQQLKSVFSPKNLAVAGVAGGIALAGAITAGLADAVRSLIDIERLNAQTDAVLRSTGGVANVTRQQIEDAAEAAESATTIQRESVQEAQNMLLTFTNVRNEVGAGNDIFTQGTEAVLDYSVATGTDAKNAAIQLGKALNDPIKGVGALSRVGITFSEDQKAMIASLVETGDLLGAQKIVLAELEKEFGGSAEAFANTTAGKIQRLQNDIGNMFESIVLGAIKVGEFLDDDPFEGFAMNFGEQGDRVHKAAEQFGQDFDDLKNRVERRMDETGESFDEAMRAIEGDLRRTSGQMPETMDEGMRATHKVVVDRGAEIRARWKETSDFIPQAIRDRWDDTRRAAFQIAVEHAKGILDGQNQVKVAFEVLTQLQEEEQTKAQRISYLQGLLSSTELQRGLNDGRPGVRGAASALRAQIVAELAALGVNAYNSGYTVGSEVARGIYASSNLADGASSYLASKISRYLPRSEPEAGPLRGITHVGESIVRSITEGPHGIYSNLARAGQAAGALAGALVPSMAMPSMALAATGVGSGGVTNQWILNVSGAEKVLSSRDDFINALDDLGAFREGRLP